MEANCDTPHCVCTVPFFQAKGDCLLCQSHANKPEAEANVQFLLDGMGATPSQVLRVSNRVFQS